MFEFIVVIIVALICFVLGGLSFARNSSAAQNKAFTLFSISAGVWAISNYFSNSGTHASKLFFNRFAYTAALLVTLGVYIFSITFPRYKKPTIFQTVVLYVLPFFFIATLTKYMVVNFTLHEGSEVTNIVSGPLYLVTMVYIVFLFSLAVFNLWRSYKKGTPDEKNRIRFVSAGTIFSFAWVAAFSAMIPYFTGDWSISLFGPPGLIVMVVAVAYAIVKHKLFDIRLIVARTLGYVLTILTVAILYALVTFGLANSLLGVEKLTGAEQVLYIVATLVFGFSLLPLKRFFDKLTNRLFYRDAYDAAELLDKLNKVLVGNIELDAILKQTADIMSTTLKAEYVAFVIRETEGTSRRASFSKIVQLDTEAILGMAQKKHGKTELFIADDIEDTRDKMKELMAANNISVAARLVASGTDAADQGYLLLGSKQSGNPYNKQDIQVLEIIANELVIAIQNALRFEEIETFNLTLQQKVNDATKQLRQTNEKLKALDETKDEFISMASHQLRTPLTSVKGYVSMVVEGDAGKLNKQQKELLDQAFASSQRMVYLIADLLNVSRLKSGKFVIENKPTQLATVVESEMEQLTEMAKSKDQTLTYQKPDKFPDLMLDETKIRQVIMNFADNALHYTPNGGHIQLILEDKGDSIQFMVVDDGLGVPKTEQHHLFTKFYRAGNAKKARPDGTGLGLFMAKKVVIAQGGAIIFKSEENKGSTFGFTFPKAKMLVTKEAKAKTAKADEKQSTEETKPTK